MYTQWMSKHQKQTLEPFLMRVKLYKGTLSQDRWVKDDTMRIHNAVKYFGPQLPRYIGSTVSIKNVRKLQLQITTPPKNIYVENSLAAI